MKSISPFIPAVCAAMFRGQQNLMFVGVLLYWILWVMCLHRTRQWVMLNTAMEITWLPLVSVPNAAEWRIIQVCSTCERWRCMKVLSFALTLAMQYNIFKVKKGLDFRCSLVVQFCAFILILLRWLTAVPVQAPAILVGGTMLFSWLDSFLLLVSYIYTYSFSCVRKVKAPFFHITGGCCLLLRNIVIFILGILSDLLRHINDSHELEVPHSFKSWFLSCIIFIASGVDK
jgi:hypothetical protein